MNCVEQTGGSNAVPLNRRGRVVSNMPEPVGHPGVVLTEQQVSGDRLTHVVVLGSTGSIGRSALDVIEHDGRKRLSAWGLSAHCRWQALAEQAAAVRRASSPWPIELRRACSEQRCEGQGSRCLGARRHHPDGAGPRDRPRVDRDRGRGRPARNLGGARSRQDRRTGQQGDAGRRRPTGHESGEVAGDADLAVDSEHSAIFQAKKAGSPGRCAG